MSREMEMFTKTSVAAIKDLSIAFAGEDDETVAAVLDTMRQRYAEQWSGAFGPETAAKIAAAFVDAITARRRRLQGATIGTA